MRRAIGLALLTAALTLSACTPNKGSEKGWEEKKLFGTWVTSGVESKGKVDTSLDYVVTFTFARDGKVTIKSKSGEGEGEGAFTVDTTRNPMELNMNLKMSNNEAKEEWKAIYQIDGDTLKLVTSMGTGLGNIRATAFNSQDRPILILKRQKP
jgi:uncharacterized protein (TIGR03067 family)